MWKTALSAAHRQSPVQRLRAGGDDDGRDRGEQERREPVIGEHEGKPLPVTDFAARFHRVGDRAMRTSPSTGKVIGAPASSRHSLMATVFVCVYSSRASMDFSRP